MIEPLIERGADINAINGGSDTALILAIESGNWVEICKIIAQKDLICENNTGFSYTQDMRNQQSCSLKKVQT